MVIDMIAANMYFRLEYIISFIISNDVSKKV